MIIKILNKFFFFPADCCSTGFNCRRFFFSLSIHTWHLNSLNVISPLLVIKIQNKIIIFPASYCYTRFNSINCTRFFFSLSIHKWHLNSLDIISPLLVIKIQNKIFFFSNRLQLACCTGFNSINCRRFLPAAAAQISIAEDFFFSLYTHVTPQFPQRHKPTFSH